MRRTVEIIYRPYKVRAEIRENKDHYHYTATFVSRTTKPLRFIVDALRERGFEPDDIKVDRYGFVRVSYRNLTHTEVDYILGVADEQVKLARSYKERVSFMVPVYA